MTARDQATIGDEKISITIVRKTRGDKLVSQHSTERWFPSQEAAVSALQALVNVFIAAPSEPDD